MRGINKIFCRDAINRVSTSRLYIACNYANFLLRFFVVKVSFQVTPN